MINKFKTKRYKRQMENLYSFMNPTKSETVKEIIKGSSSLVKANVDGNFSNASFPDLVKKFSSNLSSLSSINPSLFNSVFSIEAIGKVEEENLLIIEAIKSVSKAFFEKHKEKVDDEYLEYEYILRVVKMYEIVQDGFDKIKDIYDYDKENIEANNNIYDYQTKAELVNKVISKYNEFITSDRFDASSYSPKLKEEFKSGYSVNDVVNYSNLDTLTALIDDSMILRKIELSRVDEIFEKAKSDIKDKQNKLKESLHNKHLEEENKVYSLVENDVFDYTSTITKANVLLDEDRPESETIRFNENVEKYYKKKYEEYRNKFFIEPWIEKEETLAETENRIKEIEELIKVEEENISNNSNLIKEKNEKLDEYSNELSKLSSSNRKVVSDIDYVKYINEKEDLRRSLTEADLIISDLEYLGDECLTDEIRKKYEVSIKPYINIEKEEKIKGYLRTIYDVIGNGVFKWDERGEKLSSSIKDLRNFFIKKLPDIGFYLGTSEKMPFELNDNLIEDYSGFTYLLENGDMNPGKFNDKRDALLLGSLFIHKDDILKLSKTIDKKDKRLKDDTISMLNNAYSNILEVEKDPKVFDAVKNIKELVENKTEEEVEFYNEVTNIIKNRKEAIKVLLLEIEESLKYYLDGKQNKVSELKEKIKNNEIEIVELSEKINESNDIIEFFNLAKDIEDEKRNRVQLSTLKEDAEVIIEKLEEKRESLLKDHNELALKNREEELEYNKKVDEFVNSEISKITIQVENKKREIESKLKSQEDFKNHIIDLSYISNLLLETYRKISDSQSKFIERKNNSLKNIMIEKEYFFTNIDKIEDEIIDKLNSTNKWSVKSSESFKELILSLNSYKEERLALFHNEITIEDFMKLIGEPINRIKLLLDDYSTIKMKNIDKERFYLASFLQNLFSFKEKEMLGYNEDYLDITDYDIIPLVITTNVEKSIIINNNLEIKCDYQIGKEGNYRTLVGNLEAINDLTLYKEFVKDGPKGIKDLVDKGIEELGKGNSKGIKKLLVGLTIMELINNNELRNSDKLDDSVVFKNTIELFSNLKVIENEIPGILSMRREPEYFLKRIKENSFKRLLVEEINGMKEGKKN